MGQTIRIEIPVEVTDKTDPALSGITKKLEGMDAAAKKATQNMSGIDRTLQKMQSAKGWAKQKYQVALEAKDGVSKVLSKVKGGLGSFAGKAKTVTLKALDMASAPIRGVLNLIKSPLLAAGITLSIGATIGSAVSTYAGFQSQMSEVKAISGATEEEFAQLNAKAKEMGATTKFTAQESAEAFKYMGMAGWKASDMVSGIGGILNLAAASGENLGTTSDIVTDALTAFGLKASDSGHFADVLATAATNSNTTVSGMGDTFKYVGSMAGALGYSIEDVSLAVGLMANSGVKGTMAGTSLNAMMTRLSTNTGGATDAIKNLGVEFFNQDGSARKLSDVMGELRTATAGMSAEQKSSLANTVAGMEAQKGLLAILNASEEDYNELSTAINNADGSAENMAKTMQENLSGKFTLFQSALEGVKNALGERLEPYLMTALDWLTKKMPDVEDMLMRGMNSIDRFVENTKEKIAEFTSTPEWEGAGLFGKMKIAWDELVGKPFAQWWSGGGSDMITGKAAQIGQSIGMGLSGGLLTLLGIDIGTGINEGASIGASFANGFISGFNVDAVKSAVTGAVSGMFQNAGKIFTGGADVTSWLSAAAIAKVGAPLLKLLGGGLSLGGGLIGGIGKSAKGGLLGKLIGGYSLEEDLSGAVITKASGLKGLFGKAGVRLGSGASTAGGLALAGAGSLAGGLIGAGTLFSAGKNISKAINAKDNDERSTNIASAALKGVGVAGGAGLGAAIGSAFFGIGAVPGALIGAGIGGLAGMFGGGKVEEDYEKRKTAAEEAAAAEELMAEKTKYALKGARFESAKLKDAFKDTTVSAEQFGQMMQEAVSQKIQDGFGSIKLSVKEIEEAAKQILFGGEDENLTKYASAASDAEASLNNLQASAGSMEKLNWKAGMGLIHDEFSVSEYQAGIENMITGAQQYVENQHYQATAAISLLVEPRTPMDYTTGLNAMYGKIQEQLSGSGEELRAQMNIALEDGVITADEQKILSELQQKITDITSQITDAQTEAGMQALKIKYSGAELDAGSFGDLMSEVQTQAQEAGNQYDDALEVALTNLNMQLNSGAINQDQFDAQVQALTEGYHANIEKLGIQVESFGLQTISDAFGSELDGILPELQGTTSERLGQAMHNAMAEGVDPTTWTSSGEGLASAVEWLGLENLSSETQGAVAELMGELARSLPEQFADQLSGAEGSGIGEVFKNAVENSDFTDFKATAIGKLSEAFASMELPEEGNGLQEGLQQVVNATAENMDCSEAAATVNRKFGEAMSGMGTEDGGDMSGLQEGLQNGVTAALENLDLSAAGESLSASLGSLAEGLDYSGITSAVGNGIGSAIEAALGTISGAISNLYSQVGTAIDNAFAAGFTTTTTVTITVNYELANPTATISFSGGGTGTATVSAGIVSNAEGSIVNGRLLSWVGEDGPEAIIPLGAKRRQRGLDLWMQAGRMMGVGEYADGGIVGSGQDQYEDDEEKLENIKYRVNGKGQGDSGKGKIEVNVSVSPSFEISGSDDKRSIMQMIKANMKEIADDLGNTLAERLADSYENMPLV